MKILLITTRSICYYSASFFLERIKDALERHGFSVTYLDLSGYANDFSRLGKCLNEKYEAILDINSKLPFLVSNEERLLNKFDAPFFNYLVDHTLYHHPGLVFPIKNYHVITVDREEAGFIKENYPNIKSTHYLPLAGTEALIKKDHNDKKIDILFPGTFLDTEVIRDELKSQGPVMEQLMDDLYMAWNPRVEPIEKCLKRLLSDRHGSPEMYGMTDFNELLNHMYPVDRAKRYQIRYRIMRHLAIEGFPLTIIGSGWENTDLSDFKNVKFLPPVGISLSYEAMMDAKIVLDVNPLFYRGVHDRVPSAMANNAIVFSDMSRLADRSLQRMNGINYFDDNNDGLEELSTMIEKTLSRDPEYVSDEILDREYKKYKDDYSWDSWAYKFEKILEEIKNHALK